MTEWKQRNKQAAISSFLDKKPPKSLVQQGLEGSTAVGKDEVGSSNLPSSSKKRRKLRLSMLFCCKNAENGVSQNVGQLPDPHRDPHRLAVSGFAAYCQLMPHGYNEMRGKAKEHRRGNCLLSGALLACGTYRICAMKLPIFSAAFCCICRVAWV